MWAGAKWVDDLIDLSQVNNNHSNRTNTTILGHVYIRVWVKKNWGPKNPFIDLTFGLKLAPKLEVCFIKLGGLLS
jgi:hypothetical protein